MEQRRRDIIRYNLPLLVNELKPAVDAVCSFLYQSRIISQRMMENILKDNHTSSQKATDILDLIVYLSPHAFEVMYVAMLESQLYEAADILKPIKAPHKLAAASPQSTCSDLFPHKDGEVADHAAMPLKDVLPHHSGSSASSQSSATDIPPWWPQIGLVRKEINVKTVQPKTPMYQMYLDSLTSLGKSDYYTMTAVNRGTALIINNEHFVHPSRGANEGPEVTYYKDRKGSSYDKDNLETVFHQLGFTVKIYSDQTKENMERIFQDECKQDHSQSDCFILVILTHGQKGFVFGIDGYSIKQTNGERQHYNCIKVNSIKNMFCAITSLKEKPKLYFIQACRGVPDTIVKQTHSQESGQDACNDGVEVNPTAVGSERGDRDMDENLQIAMDTISELDSRDVTDGSGYTIPIQTDYLLAMSTISGMVSFRNEGHGSWFIQALVHVFSNHAHQYDLNRLITLTNRYVCSAEATFRNKKQVAEKRDTLTKVFHFFPGLHTALPPPSQS